FELFKTPWEPYRSGRGYDVVIATEDDTPEVSAKLLLIYGSTPKPIDARFGFGARGSRRNVTLDFQNSSIPIYGDLLPSEAGGLRVHSTTNDADVASLFAHQPNPVVVRLGFDLFDEVRFLLSAGQPAKFAQIPTLELHIQLIREAILESG